MANVIRELDGTTLVEQARTVAIAGADLSYVERTYSVHGIRDGISCTSGPLLTRTYADHVFNLWTDNDYADRFCALVDTSSAVNGSVRCSLSQLSSPMKEAHK